MINRSVAFGVQAAARKFYRSFGTAGQDLYQEYLETLEQLKQFQEEQERHKSLKLFEAWKRSSQHVDDAANTKTASKKAGGVAVIRTMTKQQSKEAHHLQQQRELQERADAQLRIAAEDLRYPAALVQLANNLLLQDDLAQQGNIQKILNFYRAAGEQGWAEGWFNLGHCLWTGIDGVLQPDVDQALVAFDKAIELGDYDAMYFVGVHRLGQFEHDGNGSIDTAIVQQLRQALQWIECAADSGHHGGALHYLAVFYLNGYTPLQITPCPAADFPTRLELAIKHDDTGEAHFLRGSCYYAGDSGYARDIRQALADFLVAADLGNGDAAVSAGAILHRGVPAVQIPRNQQRAFELYQLAGELGNVDGWRNVVACYATGEGVKQSTETAKYIAETMLREKDEP